MRDRIQKFEILRLLGKGAMGEVYLGRDPLLGREVAIKVIKTDSGFGEEARARFAREAKASASLNHPHVVTVFEFGEEDDLLFLAMEYLEGQDLDTLIREGRTPKPELLEVLVQVCHGLGYAHEHGLVHRDVKPANILVTRHGNHLNAKLMDFGVALVAGSNLTQDGTWMGTISYMAPEYLDTGKATPSLDLFALGVILYEILSGGRKPFGGDTPTMILSSILRKPPAPLRLEETGGLGKAMLAVVERALDKDPDQRFPTAEALGQAVMEALNEPKDDEAPPPEPAPESPAASQAKVLTVGKGGTGQFLSLRVALRNAGAGSVIQVSPGVYRETLLIDKDITLVAKGSRGETILESPGDCPLVLQSGHARFEGLTLRVEPASTASAVSILGGSPSFENCLFEGGAEAAVRVDGEGIQAQFRDCHFQAPGQHALVLRGSSQARIEACTLEGFLRSGWWIGPNCRGQAAGLRVGPADGVGVWVGRQGQVGLEDSEVSACGGGGIEIEPGGSAEVRRCRLVGSRFAGVMVMTRGRATLEECEVGAHAGAGLHARNGASIVALRCRISGNDGFGLSLQGGALATLDACEIQGNGAAGILIPGGATVQVRNSRVFEGRSLGIDCGMGGQAALDGCEIYGNAGVGARVEAGGNLLLARCILRDGRDTGLLLLGDSKATLEECVVHRNARGGILLAREAADPELRGDNRIEDDLFRITQDGTRTKVAPLRTR